MKEDKSKRKIICTNSIVDMTQTSNEVGLGKISIGQMVFYPDSIWIETEEGEGGQFRKSSLEKLLLEWFNKNF